MVTLVIYCSSVSFCFCYTCSIILRYERLYFVYSMYAKILVKVKNELITSAFVKQTGI